MGRSWVEGPRKAVWLMDEQRLEGDFEGGELLQRALVADGEHPRHIEQREVASESVNEQQRARDTPAPFGKEGREAEHARADHRGDQGHTGGVGGRSAHMWDAIDSALPL